jgi:hypothetical protein
MIPAFPRGERVAAACTMRATVKKGVLAAVLGLGLLLPASASAVTLDEVLGLARAGVTDAIILALIDRDKTVFAIEPEQIVQLQKDGLSEPVILAMLKSGRQEGDQAARADAASNSAWIMASLPTEPLLVITGHGPDRPNVAHPDGFYSGPPAYFPSFSASRRYYGPRSNGSFRYDVPRQMCVAQLSTARSTRPLSYVTECPDVMQPRRVRD